MDEKLLLFPHPFRVTSDQADQLIILEYVSSCQEGILHLFTEYFSSRPEDFLYFFNECFSSLLEWFLLFFSWAFDPIQRFGEFSSAYL